MPMIHEVYKGHSGGYYSHQVTSHRYVLEVGADHVKYLALSGSIVGQVRVIKRKTWDAWASVNITPSKYANSWVALIENLCEGSPISDLENTNKDKLQVATKGKLPIVVMGKDIEPGMTVVYGAERYLAVTDGEDADSCIYLIDLSSYVMSLPADAPYIVAQAKLILSV